MNIISSLLFLLLGALVGITSLVAWALLSDEETSDSYLEEELALAEFLDKRQSVNEDFLLAQHQILKELATAKKSRWG